MVYVQTPHRRSRGCLQTVRERVLVFFFPPKRENKENTHTLSLSLACLHTLTFGFQFEDDEEKENDYQHQKHHNHQGTDHTASYHPPRQPTWEK